MRSRWGITALLVAALAGSPLFAGLSSTGAGAAAPGANAAPGASRIGPWTACDRPLQCTTIEVPLDYDDPTGPQIELAMIRLPASDPARRIGSLFLNPGGPGGSGVEFVREAGTLLFTKAVRSRFDLVGFDPRGIGSSTPLTCFGSASDVVAQPRVFPTTGRQQRTFFANDEAYAAKCLANAGPVIDHMSTANVARDLDLMREAVGDDRLTYVGYSYGTQLGATYANLFPNRMRAVVLDGVVDPVAWSTGTPGVDDSQPASTRLRSEIGAWATLRAFFRQCDAHPVRCAFSRGNAQARFAALAQRLRQKDVVEIFDDGSESRFGYAELIGFTLSPLYSPALWPELADFLLQIDLASQGRTPTLRIDARLSALGLGFPQTSEGFPGVLCSEADNPSNPSAWIRAGADADLRAPYFGRLWTWLSSICAVWPAQDADRYTGPYTATSDRTVLVVGTRFDPATRYQSARRVAALLGNARLLTLDGWGHTSAGSSRCIDQKVSRYLLLRQLPDEGTVCRADLTPFEGPPFGGLGAAARRRSQVREILMAQVPKPGSMR